MGMSYKHVYKYFLSCEKFQLIRRKPAGCSKGTGKKWILGVRQTNLIWRQSGWLGPGNSRFKFQCFHSLTPRGD